MEKDSQAHFWSEQPRSEKVEVALSLPLLYWRESNYLPFPFRYSIEEKATTDTITTALGNFKKEILELDDSARLDFYQRLHKVASDLVKNLNRVSFPKEKFPTFLNSSVSPHPGILHPTTITAYWKNTFNQMATATKNVLAHLFILVKDEVAQKDSKQNEKTAGEATKNVAWNFEERDFESYTDRKSVV